MSEYEMASADIIKAIKLNTNASDEKLKEALIEHLRFWFIPRDESMGIAIENDKKMAELKAAGW